MKDFFIGFTTVCLCGLFIALAGGVEWGTEDCGGVAASTLLFAFFAGMHFADTQVFK